MSEHRLDLVSAWTRWVDVLKPVLQTHPELIPVIRQWASAMSDAQRVHPFQQAREKLFTRGTSTSNNNSINQAAAAELETSTQLCDVLFIPKYNRSNYLGAVQTVARALWEREPQTRLGILPPDEVAEIDERFVHQHFSLSRLPNGEDYWRMAQLMAQILRHGRRDKELFVWLLASMPMRLAELLWFLKNVRYARTWLQATQCRVLICLNEQLSPASYLVAAARSLNITSCQILHGSPTRLYWPFMSNETWVWGETTRHVLAKYGAPNDKLTTVGSLEANYWKRLLDEMPRAQFVESKEPSARRCLFLSQWIGSEVWGVPGFDEPLRWLLAALRRHKNWMLTIRLHPLEGTETEQEIRAALELPADIQFSNSKTPLIEDVLKADLVCTGSSTAVLTALAAERPAFFIWTSAMVHIHAHPFLDDTHVVYTEDELAATLEHMFSSVEPRGEQQQSRVLHSLENVDDIAAQRIQHLLH